MKMTTRKINRLIIKKDGKVYSFRCLAASGAITLYCFCGRFVD